MKKLMVLPLLLVMLVSLTANAASHGKKDWEWWNSGRTADKLELTEEQQTELKGIAEKFAPMLTEAKDNVTTARTAFTETKTNKENSSGDVIKAFDTMWDTKYKMKRVKLDRFLEMRDVLTQEQLTTLSEIKQAHKDKMMKKHHKMKDKKEKSEDKSY